MGSRDSVTDLDFQGLLRPLIPKGIVLTPESDDYEEAIQRWSQTCVKRAAVVVKPSSVQEVSEAVKFATSHKVPFVVKCGGHATSGVSSCEDGMVIDMALLNTVTVNTASTPDDQNTVTFGGGCRWSEVDQALWKHGLATVGGTVSDTGVGGLILGGGYGFLSPKYGLSIDLLTSAQVVTADGSIRTCSATENEDLFWAIRGAGQNFGVATEFTMKAFPQGRVYSGFAMFPTTALSALVDFANNMIEKGDERSACVFGSAFLPPTFERGLIAILFYNGTEEEGKTFYKPILDHCIMNMAKEIDWPTVNSQLGQVPEGRKWRRLQGGATFIAPLKVDEVQASMDDFMNFVEEQQIKESTMLIYEVLPNKKVIEVGHKDTAFAARDDMYHISTVWQWENPEQDGTIRQFNRSIIRKLKESGVKEGVTQYNNYDTGGPISPENAFGVNLERLRELKVKYDPDNVFFKWLSLYPEPASGTA